jgi:TRAP-type C4-dicarboxylate transport system substrate-binding protein
MKPPALWLVVVALTATAALSGCGAAAPTRAGGESDPRTLSAAAYFSAGYPAGDQLLYLADVVNSPASGLTLQTLPTPEDEGGSDNPGLTTLEAVRDGRLDLAIVPARVFDLAGIYSLQALQAPFHFTSAEQADALLDDPVTARMLDPLMSLGVNGLALTFDALRTVIGYDRPLSRVDDFSGQGIAARPSKATDDALAALGAQVSRAVGSDLIDEVNRGSVVGLEDSINQPNGEVPGWFVVNAILSFKADVIVVNSKVWLGLDPTEQSSLQRAADQTMEWSRSGMSQHLDLEAAAEAICADGVGDVVLATPADLQSLKAATQPLVEAMQRDPVSEAALARIDSLAETVGPTRPAIPCSREIGPGVGLEPLPARGDQSLLNGTWRIVVDGDVLRAAGVSEADAANNEGVWNWTFNNGEASFSGVGDPPCHVSYTLADGIFAMEENVEAGCGDTSRLAFQRSKDRMHFSNAVAATPEDEAFLNAFWSKDLTLLAGANPG